MKKPTGKREEPVVLEALLLAGSEMANVFFNLGQNGGPLAKYHDTLRRWDAAYSALLAHRRGTRGKRG